MQNDKENIQVTMSCNVQFRKPFSVVPVNKSKVALDICQNRYKGDLKEEIVNSFVCAICFGISYEPL